MSAEPVLKSKRDACWGARDVYWSCVDANGGELDGSDAVKQCAALRKAFAAACPHSWVAHFDRKYQLDKFKRDVEAAGWRADLPEETK